MTSEEIIKDREERQTSCKAELEAVLTKYEFGLTAEEHVTPNLKVAIQISFMDMKKYDNAVVAEPTVVKTPIDIESTPVDPTPTPSDTSTNSTE